MSLNRNSFLLKPGYKFDQLASGIKVAQKLTDSVDKINQAFTNAQLKSKGNVSFLEVFNSNIGNLILNIIQNEINPQIKNMMRLNEEFQKINDYLEGDEIESIYKKIEFLKKHAAQFSDDIQNSPYRKGIAPEITDYVVKVSKKAADDIILICEVAVPKDEYKAPTQSR